MSTPKTDSDGDNVTALDDSDADSETVGGYEAKNEQIWNNYPSCELPQETQCSYT